MPYKENTDQDLRRYWTFSQARIELGLTQYQLFQKIMEVYQRGTGRFNSGQIEKLKDQKV